MPTLLLTFTNALLWAFRHLGIRFPDRRVVCFVFLLFVALPPVWVSAAPLPFQGRILMPPSGKHLVTWQNQELLLWERKIPKVLKKLTFDTALYQVEISHDGRFLVAGFITGEYRRWHFPAMVPAGVLQLRKEESVQWPFAVSPDGTYLTRTLFEQKIIQDIMHLEVWDWRTRRRVNTLWAHQQPLQLGGHYPGSQLAFHPLGGYLAFATEEGQLKVFDTRIHRWQYDMPGSPPLSYAENGKYFAFCIPDAKTQGIRSVKLWHLPTNRLKTFQVSEMSATESALILSQSGRYLAYTERSQGKRRKLVVRSVAGGKTLLSTWVPEEVDSLSIPPEENGVLTSSLLRPDTPSSFYAF